MWTKYGVKNVKRRRRRNARAMSRVPAASNGKARFEFVREGRERTMWRWKDRVYCWMWMRRRKSVRGKRMENPCTQGTSLLLWIVWEDNYSAGISPISPGNFY